MNRPVIALLTGLALVASAQADVPVYRNQELTLNGAVVIDENETTYYGDIRLSTNPDGTFNLVEAKRRHLADVDSVDVVILESFPVQVRVEVEGPLSIACVDLEKPGVVREGNTFTIVLAETPLDPLILCTMQLVYYDVSIPLDVHGLEAGEYTVVVNGVESSFTLDVDNF